MLMATSTGRHLLGNDLVREARRRAGLTQRELAERAGTTQSAIARLEGGHTSPSFEKVLALVRHCGLDLAVGIVEHDHSAIEQAMRNLLLEPEERIRQLKGTVRFVEAGRVAVREARGA
jgi:transcriptional regulator with XRE-family HTH domain